MEQSLPEEANSRSNSKKKKKKKSFLLRNPKVYCRVKKEFASGSYHESDDSNPHLPAQLLEDTF
jgi:hypothetical protein